MPANALLNQLVEACRGATIQFPQLRAISLAQWMLESGRATSALATLHNNFGGLKWRAEMAPYATKVQYGAHDGVDFYCKFSSPEAFIKGYWAFLGRSPYKGWKDHVATPGNFIRFIGPIYTPKAGYADDVLALMSEAAGLLAVPAPVPVVHPPQVTVDLGTIVIDPGHGGKPSETLPSSSWNNARSVSGAYEKDLTLAFCLILRDQLKAQATAAGETIKVVMTRTTDINLAASARARKTGENGAKAFVCLHFNGGPPAIEGSETFYRAAANGNVNLAADMAFSGALHKAMIDGLRQVRPTTKDRKLKPDTDTGIGALGVLNDKNLGNTQPSGRLSVSAYFEVEYITNPAVDTALISGPNAIANRTTVMASIAKAIRAQMKALP